MKNTIPSLLNLSLDKMGWGFLKVDTPLTFTYFARTSTEKKTEKRFPQNKMQKSEETREIKEMKNTIPQKSLCSKL